jgi:hypothetical protein
MPCWAWVAPLILRFIPSWLLAASHGILLNQGMKYWDSGVNAPGLRTFVATVHIGMQQWLVESVRENQGQGKLSLVLSFMPCWSPVYFVFFSCFWTLVPYMTKQGGSRAVFCLTLRITLMYCKIFQKISSIPFKNISLRNVFFKKSAFLKMI